MQLYSPREKKHLELETIGKRAPNGLTKKYIFDEDGWDSMTIYYTKDKVCNIKLTVEPQSEAADSIAENYFEDML